MFGPKPYKVLIFKKTKLWWENSKKIHLPEERKRLSREEIIDLTKANQLIEMEINRMLFFTKKRESDGKIINFERLSEAFFREYPYEYGKKIKKRIKRKNESDQIEN